MITSGQLIIGSLTGSVLIFLCLFPRVFQGLAEGVREGVTNFKASLTSFPIQPHRYEPIRTPRLWLAVSGMALIAATVFAYVQGCPG